MSAYQRGCETLVASWAEYARGSTGATVRHLPGVNAAVFPGEPERDVYNNALLDRGLGHLDRSRVVDAMEAAYAEAGITRFAAWVHESDHAMRTEIERRGYTVDTTTRAMGRDLDSLDDVEDSLTEPPVDLGPAAWSEYVQYEGLPPDFLARADHAALHVLVAREDGEIVAASLAYDLGDDCGIYNVATLPHARGRGLASAVTVAQLRAARARGRRTASLQSTPMAQRLYARLGFHDLGRILEYVP
ncbi:MAG TPA: GNAT family N-acetyltransferase [Micromonosporaceae bacterium]